MFLHKQTFYSTGKAGIKKMSKLWSDFLQAFLKDVIENSVNVKWRKTILLTSTSSLSWKMQKWARPISSHLDFALGQLLIYVSYFLKTLNKAVILGASP